MYRFRVKYYLDLAGLQRALWLGVVANNYGDAERKATRSIRYKYPGAGYNVYSIEKTKKLKK